MAKKSEDSFLEDSRDVSMMEFIDNVLQNPDGEDRVYATLPKSSIRELIGALEELEKSGLDIEVTATIYVEYDSDGSQVKAV